MEPTFFATVSTSPHSSYISRYLQAVANAFTYLVASQCTCGIYRIDSVWLVNHTADAPAAFGGVSSCITSDSPGIVGDKTVIKVPLNKV